MGKVFPADAIARCSFQKWIIDIGYILNEIHLGPSCPQLSIYEVESQISIGMAEVGCIVRSYSADVDSVDVLASKRLYRIRCRVMK